MDKRMWTREETMLLIEKYEEYPELWDTKCKDFKNKIKKQAALRSLSQQFTTTDAEVNRKLHNLRTQFNQELKKVQNKRSIMGEEDTYNSKWEYFDAMKFTKCSHSSTSIKDDIQDVNTEQIVCEPIQINSQSSSETSHLMKKNRKRVSDSNASSDIVSDKPLKIMNKPDDEYQLFGAYVASELRSLHWDTNKRELKRMIQRSILQISEKDENQFSAYFTEVSSEQSHLSQPTDSCSNQDRTNNFQ